MDTPINKLLKMLKISDEDEVLDDDYIDDAEEPEQERPSRNRSYNQDNGSSITDRRRSDDSRSTKAPRSERLQSKVVPYKSGRSKGSSQLEVHIHKPEQFDDAAEICNILISGSPVIVNLEGFDSHEAQRIMDFICGCIHALNGSLRQISKYIFIFSPYDVEISGDITFDVNGVPTFKRTF